MSVKLSELPGDNSLTGVEKLLALDGSISKTLTLQQIADFVIGQIGAPVTPTLSAVTNLAASMADGHSVLTWTAPTGATGYKVKKDGAQIATPSTNTYDVGSLTNGTQYVLAVIPTANGYNDGPAVSVNVTPAAPSVPNNVEWLSTDVYPYPALVSADALSWDHSAPIGAPGSDIVLDVHDHPDNYHMAIRFKDTNILPTKYDEGGTSNINIGVPGVQFTHIFQARGYTYLVTNEDGVTFNPDPSARLTLHT